MNSVKRVFAVAKATGRASAVSRPDVSVIIVGWNTRDILMDCLRSVYSETREVEFEVIYIDNASRDDSVATARREFPSVTIVENKENLGFVAGCNQGIARAEGRYALLLNSDTIILEDAISKVLRFADRHPLGAAFGCRVLNPNLSTQLSCFMVPSLLNMLLSASYLNHIFPRSRFFGRQMMTWWDYSDEREVETVSGCFILVRRVAIEAIGMMDPVYYFYGDDLDWCYRFRKAGWKVMYTPSASIIHFGGQSSKYMRRTFRLQLFGTTLLFLRLNKNRLAFIAGSILNSLFFALRCPYWLARSVLCRRERRASLQEAGTCAIGSLLSIFDWKRMLMNRDVVEARLR